MQLRNFLLQGTRTAFARQVGVPLSYLHQICQGHRRPSWFLALRISAATGGAVSVESLLGGGEMWPAAARLRDIDPVPTPTDVIRIRNAQLRAAGCYIDDDHDQELEEAS